MRAAPRPILRGCGGCSCEMVDIVSCRRKPHNLENMAWIQLRHTGEKKGQLLLSSQPPAPVLVPQPCAAAAAKDDFSRPSTPESLPLSGLGPACSRDVCPSARCGKEKPATGARAAAVAIP